MRMIDADILVQDTIQEYARSKQYRDAIIRMVNKAPTIEPKRGEWVETFDHSRLAPIRRFACSECKAEWLPEVALKYKFCPNCGADMREREGE